MYYVYIMRIFDDVQLHGSCLIIKLKWKDFKLTGILVGICEHMPCHFLSLYHRFLHIIVWQHCFYLGDTNNPYFSWGFSAHLVYLTGVNLRIFEGLPNGNTFLLRYSIGFRRGGGGSSCKHVRLTKADIVRQELLRTCILRILQVPFVET